MIGYAVSVPARAPVSPQVEGLLEEAVSACLTIARDPAQVAAALEGTLVAAELLARNAPTPAQTLPARAPLLDVSWPQSDDYLLALGVEDPPPADMHVCSRCTGAGMLILDRVERETGAQIDVECPGCRGTGVHR